MLRKKVDNVQWLICRGTALLTGASLEREVGGMVSAKTLAAFGEVLQRLERSNLTNPGGLYNLACLCSTQSGQGPLVRTMPAPQAQREENVKGDRAMAALRRAVDAGWNDLKQTSRDLGIDPRAPVPTSSACSSTWHFRPSHSLIAFRWIRRYLPHKSSVLRSFDITQDLGGTEGPS
jgi:hypothetical protein